MLGRNALPAWFFIVLDLFPDTFSACMRCVNFNFVYFWSYPDLFRIQKKGISATFQIFSKKKKVPKNQHFFIYYPYFLDINTTHSTCLDTLELITYADLFPRRYVFGNKSAIFPFLGRSRVWMYILRQFVSMIWFVIESQELSFHAFLFDTIILVRIPEQTHFRWQNQND